MKSGAHQQGGDQDGREDQEEDDQAARRGGPAVEAAHAFPDHQEAADEQQGNRDAQRRRQRGTEDADDQHGKTLRRGGEGPPEKPDDVAMLEPERKGDRGGHEQNRDVDDEQGLDVESHRSFTL